MGAALAIYYGFPMDQYSRPKWRAGKEKLLFCCGPVVLRQVIYAPCPLKSPWTHLGAWQQSQRNLHTTASSTIEARPSLLSGGKFLSSRDLGAPRVSPAVPYRGQARNLQVIDLPVARRKVKSRPSKFAGLHYHPDRHRPTTKSAAPWAKAPPSNLSGLLSVGDVDKLVVPHPDRIAISTQTTAEPWTKPALTLWSASNAFHRRPRCSKSGTSVTPQRNRQLGVKQLRPCAACCSWLVRRMAQLRRLVGGALTKNVPASCSMMPLRVNPAWLERIQTVAVTAGASAQKAWYRELISRLQTHFGFETPGRDGTERRCSVSITGRSGTARRFVWRPAARVATSPPA